MAKPTPAKKETNIVTMKDVIYMFSSVSRPIEQLNTDNKPPQSAKTSPTFGLEFHSFEIKVLISESRFKKLKKEFKGAKNITNAKEFEKDDLLEKYECLNEADLSDDMVLIKFSQSCLVGNLTKKECAVNRTQLNKQASKAVFKTYMAKQWTKILTSEMVQKGTSSSVPWMELTAYICTLSLYV